jgi:hypothetical protein
VLLDYGVDGVNFIEQVWSFAPFGYFNQAVGDGGQIVTTTAGRAYATTTQDGGTPVLQTFCGDSWVFAKNDIKVWTWTEAVVKLSISLNGPGECNPANLVPALTRYIIYTDYLCYKGSEFGYERQFCGNSLVSEHYDNDTIAGSCAMERSFFFWHHGLVRWEAWNRCGATPGADLAVRMPITILADPPGYVMVDGRNWMHFRAPNPAIPASTWGWKWWPQLSLAARNFLAAVAAGPLGLEE